MSAREALTFDKVLAEREKQYESLTDFPLTTERAEDTKAGTDSQIERCEVAHFSFMRKVER